MKKITATLLSVLLALGFVTSCQTNEERNEKKNRERSRYSDDDKDDDDDDEDDDDKDDEDDDDEDDDDKDDKDDDSLSNLAAPQVYYDKTRVDASDEFTDYKFKKPPMPWAEENNLNFVSSDVESPATLVIVDAYTGDPIDSAKSLTDSCIVQLPDVTISQSTREGYVDYYITYSHIFPFKAEMDSGDSSHSGMSYFYYGIELVDYYTGAVFPSINQNGDVDSYYVSGNLTIDGEEYFIECYADRESYSVKNNSTESGGKVTWEMTEQIDNTIVVTVPKDYDGLLMCVYTGEEQNTVEELTDINDGKLIDFHIFGERSDEYDVKQYSFFKMFDIGNGQYLK